MGWRLIDEVEFTFVFSLVQAFVFSLAQAFIVSLAQAFVFSLAQASTPGSPGR